MSTSQDSTHSAQQQRLIDVVESVRRISRLTDPQEVVREYGLVLGEQVRSDHFLALSRRDVDPPRYLITRSSRWTDTVNPWKQKDRLPNLDHGVLGELIYGDEPIILDDFTCPADDPAAEYLAGQRTIVAIPTYDEGVALNMVVLTWERPHAFDAGRLAEALWLTNVTGRATLNLVLSERLREAYRAVDHELEMVAKIQRSLLPGQLPQIEGLELAVDYVTSRRAGGDYYDFLPLPDGRIGLLIADASGHGTPAAVIMAIVHSLVHARSTSPWSPAEMFEYLNRRLAERYTNNLDAFVTAFLGVYDPRDRTLTYVNAGHPPPRLWRAADAAVRPLSAAHGLPLGITAQETFPEATEELQAGDCLALYTDGIIEAQNTAGELLGTRRLDDAICARQENAAAIATSVRETVERYVADEPVLDDQTLLVVRVK
jgi:sigma-B regulation protein RsbU (phosphoserine phosphatase)